MILQKVNIFDLQIANVDMQEACEEVVNLVNTQGKYHGVFTPNAHMTLMAIEDDNFKQILQDASLLLADGMPVVWASKYFGTPLKGKVSGSTFFQESCATISRYNLNAFFLGAMPGVAQLAADKLKEKYPQLNVVGCYSPDFGFENDPKENGKIIELLKNSGADVLYVGLSEGKGEKWIVENKERYQIPVSIQIGAAFDFAAGLKKIPPKTLKNVGLGWLWRLMHEPKRLWKRYLIKDIQIFEHIIKEKKKRKNYA
ncbi:WecB/TagA/CpsF family glycosyltransferase [Marinifilum sp.]|uniref:WecB/TagA/CpsF family glycosyltransferase n=1 Tax=Marinifilum sp. TaxID=2033137 RepID=UPI003BABB127